MRRPFAALLLVTTGCMCGTQRTRPALDHEAPVFAVGPAWLADTTETFRVITKATYDQGPGCSTADRLRGYCLETETEDATILSAEVADPSVFAVENISGATFSLRPLMPGSTTVQLVVRTVTGAEVTLFHDFTARAPEKLVVVPACRHEQPATVYVPPSSTLKLDVSIEAAGERLVTRGLPRFDFGALVSPDGGFSLEVPSQPIATAVTSPDFPGFSLPVRTYSQADLTGFRLWSAQLSSERIDGGTYPTYHHWGIDGAHRIGGDDVCFEPEGWERIFSLDAGSVCELNGMTDGGVVRTTDAYGVGLMSRLPGPCQLFGTSAVTGRSDSVTLVYAR